VLVILHLFGNNKVNIIEGKLKIILLFPLIFLFSITMVSLQITSSGMVDFHKVRPETVSNKVNIVLSAAKRPTCFTSHEYNVFNQYISEEK
jgi:hypothetical protein